MKVKKHYPNRDFQLGILPDAGFMRLTQVLSVMPISKTAWYEGIKEGKFPAPVKLGERTAAWRVQDIRNLITRLGGEV
ncbi:MAG: transcriptional regulator [Proteobacteria bacterium]|nr:MAG: transcriptional regulator [Pseudomonadota bacterium]